MFFICAFASMQAVDCLEQSRANQLEICSRTGVRGVVLYKSLARKRLAHMFVAANRSKMHWTKTTNNLRHGHGADAIERIEAVNDNPVNEMRVIGGRNSVATRRVDIR